MAEDSHLKNLQNHADEALVSEIPASKFMAKNVFTIPEGTKIYNAIKTLSTHKISGAPVINGARKIVGIVTEFDLLIQAATQDVAQPVIYTKEVVTVTPDTPLKEILVILYSNKKRFRRVPVVNSTREVLGIISRIDVLNQLMKGKSK